jgi:acyl-coenzyme A thioesterase PaaI-like protein
MRMDRVDGNDVRALLPATPSVALEVGGAIDPLVLLPFIDQLASAPLIAHGGADTTMATIDLAIHIAAAPGDRDLIGTARTVGPVGAGAALVTAQVQDSAGVAIATGTAWFSMGKPPGGGGPAERVDRAVVATGPFQPMIGLAGLGEDSATLAPHRWEAIGWTGLPALHGGAVAAALARAGQQRIATLGRDDLRLASIAVRYLRAARDSGAQAVATVDAIGRRTARLSAALTIAGDPVASAQLLFLADA